MTTIARAALLAAALLVLPSAALAQSCTLGTAPQLPDGASASEEEMKAAQTAVKAFMTETQEFLDCLQVSSRGRLTGDMGRQYEDASKRMERLAADFNKQLRAFKARG